MAAGRDRGLPERLQGQRQSARRGPLIVTSSVAAAAPTDPNALPTLAFTLPSTAPTLNPNVLYWAVINTASQPLTLGITSGGLYTGAYQTFGTSGWQPSPESTERVALALHSRPCSSP